jgi:hypothetical protein
MELASTESIHALMSGYGNATRVLTPIAARLRYGVQNIARTAKKGRKMRCKCGQCIRCLDDARWERIFADKFADPNYYTHPVTRGGSSLTSL